MTINSVPLILKGVQCWEVGDLPLAMLRHVVINVFSGYRMLLQRMITVSLE